MIDRRTLLISSAAAFASPATEARAQQRRRLPIIAVITAAGKTADMRIADTPNTSLAAFLGGMRDQGYVQDRDFIVEPRAGQSTPDIFEGLIAELIAAKPDVIVAPGPLLPWLKKSQTAIPVVMAGSGDPVLQDYIESLARPGRNYTGLSDQSVEVTGKRLEMLKEIAPGGGPVGVLWDEQARLVLAEAQRVAALRSWPLLPLEIRAPSDIEKAMTAAAAANANGLLVSATGLLFGRAPFVAKVAAEKRLATMFGARHYVQWGGLISYAPNLNDIWRRTAGFVDKILKGAKPGDLPVQQPTKFELVINARTAKTLGLTIPPTLLAFADEVIE
jgi:putative tryptophan/tyrosine transport system substrate-binding protein